MTGASAEPLWPVFGTVLVESAGRMVTLTLNRPDRANSINGALLRDLQAALDIAERAPNCRVIVLRGQAGVFCTGMDFTEVAAPADSAERVQMGEYMALLKRLSQSPKIIVSRVEGRVVAGGMGFVAASDMVLASAKSEFSLSEALWGILPCCVLPFLIRRIGFQKAYTMTLTTRPIGATEAAAIHLVDEVTDQPDETLRRLMLRFGLLREETIVELKRYFQKMWILSPEMEQTAVTEIARLVAKPSVQEGILGYTQNGRFPWETER